MKKILLVALLTLLSTNVFAGTITGAVCTKNGQTIRTSDDIFGFMKENQAKGWNCQYTRD